MKKMLSAGVSFYQLIWSGVIKYGQAANILTYSLHFRDGPLQNLWGKGAGGGDRSTQKILAQGKIKWKKFLHAN